MSNDEWKKEQMKVVCDIMNELVQKEGIQCTPKMLTPTLVQASAASVSGSSASSTSSPETIEQIRQKALDRLVNLLESNPEVKHVLAQTDISETTYWLAKDKKILTALDKIITAQTSQEVSALEMEAKKIIIPYAAELLEYITKEKKRGIVLPRYYKEYIYPLDIKVYTLDYDKLKSEYTKIIEYNFFKHSSVPLTTEEVNDRASLYSNYPNTLSKFNTDYGQTISKNQAIWSTTFNEPILKTRLTSKQDPPKGWNDVVVKYKNLVELYKNLNNEGTDQEKLIRKITYNDALIEYEKIKKIYSIRGGSRRNMNRGRRFTRKVIH